MFTFGSVLLRGGASLRSVRAGNAASGEAAVNGLGDMDTTTRSADEISTDSVVSPDSIPSDPDWSDAAIGLATPDRDTAIDTPDLDLAIEFRPILLRLDLLVRRQNTQYALSRAQTSILHTLACHGRLRMSDLARLENVRVPTTSNSVSVIEAMGYVVREPDESDRRGVCVRLTDLGRSRIEQVLRDRDLDFAHRMTQLPPEHRQLLAEAVPALNALLDAFDEDQESTGHRGASE